MLPFGATASVYAFNRVSKSLHHIFWKLLFSLGTCFYDDFPTISPKASSSILTKALSAVLDLLGWDHAKVGTKAYDFAADFNALGVSVQLSQLHHGAFVLANKEGRVEKICSMLRSVQDEGCITRSKAAELQGQLNFATGFFLSKSLQFLVASFGRLADMPRSLVSADLQLLCTLTETMLTSMPPRQFVAGSFARPLILFTDGAWESRIASAGAVVYDPDDGITTAFEIQVPGKLAPGSKLYPRLKCLPSSLSDTNMQTGYSTGLASRGSTTSRRSTPASKVPQIPSPCRCWPASCNSLRTRALLPCGTNESPLTPIQLTCRREAS